MTVIPIGLTDAAAADIRAIDAACKRELVKTARLLSELLWSVGALRGPGNQDARERRILELLDDLYEEGIIEHVRVQAARDRVSRETSNEQHESSAELTID